MYGFGDIATGAEIKILGPQLVGSAAFSPAGDHVITTPVDQTARIWDIATGVEINVLKHNGDVSYAAFSPTGDGVVTTSNDTAQICDARTTTGIPMWTLKHEGWISSAAFSPTGDRLVTASGVIAQIWDTSTGAEIKRLQHDDGCLQVAFSASGEQVITVNQYGSLRIWDAGSPIDNSIIDYARAAAIRTLTNEERSEFFLSEKPAGDQRAAQQLQQLSRMPGRVNCAGICKK